MRSINPHHAIWCFIAKSLGNVINGKLKGCHDCGVWKRSHGLAKSINNFQNIASKSWNIWKDKHIQMDRGCELAEVSTKDVLDFISRYQTKYMPEYLGSYFFSSFICLSLMVCFHQFSEKLYSCCFSNDTVELWLKPWITSLSCLWTPWALCWWYMAWQEVKTRNSTCQFPIVYTQWTSPALG